MSKNNNVTDSATYGTTEKIFIGIAMTLLSLITTLSNLGILLISYKTRRLRKTKSSQTFFIVLLAVADFLVGLFSVNFYTIYVILDYWPFGTVVCYFWLVIDHWMITVSNFFVVGIALNRFVSIYYPILHRMVHAEPRNKKFVICFIWFIAIFVWGPSVAIYTKEIDSETGRDNLCFVSVQNEDAIVTFFGVLFSYFIPVALLLVSYAGISYNTTRRVAEIYVEYPMMGNALSKDCFGGSNQDRISDAEYENTQTVQSKTISADEKIRKALTAENWRMKSSSMNSLQVASVKSASTQWISKISRSSSCIETNTTSPQFEIGKSRDRSVTTSSHSIYVTHSTRNRYIKSNRRGVRFLCLISLVFIVMWMPYHIVMTLYAFKTLKVSQPVWNFCYIFGWVNSLLNPYCYALGSKQFRRQYDAYKHHCIRKRKNRINDSNGNRSRSKSNT